MTKYSTEQEAFWAGEFGDAYIGRNQQPALVAANIALFGQVLARCGKISSVIELGANIGLNLVALRSLLPQARLRAVEINGRAVEQLRRLDGVEVVQGSLLQYEPRGPADLAFTKTVLIHVAPEDLPRAYDVLYRSARRYVLVAEYYNPVPAEVVYRGHTGRLFKRDFAGDLLGRYADLRLVDYGFVYRRDAFPQDDISWFLLEKRI